MWALSDRARLDRSGSRYPSDLTDEEWALVAPAIPPGKPGGGKRSVDLRSVVDGLLYVLSTGCRWRTMPADLAPRSTVHGYFELWRYDGTLARIHQALFVTAREQSGQSAIASAGHLVFSNVRTSKNGRRGFTQPARQATKQLKDSVYRPGPQTTLKCLLLMMPFC